MSRKTESFNHFRINNKEVASLVGLALLIEVIFYISINGFYLASYFGALVIVIVSLGLDIKKNIFMFILLIANQRILVLPNNDISLINILIFMIIFKQIYSGKFRLQYKTFFLLLVFITYSIAPFVISGNIGILMIAIRVSILMLMLMNIKYSTNNQLDIYLNIIIYFILGVIIMGVLGIAFDKNFVLGTQYRFSGSDLNNPNDFSMLVIFSISLLIYINRKIQIKNKLLLITISILTFLGLITQSRTFILGIAIIISFYLITFLKPRINRYFKTRSIVQGLVLLTFVIAIMLTPPFTAAIESSLDRIINPRRGDISGSRLDLWIQYYDFLKANTRYLLFGTGANLDILNNNGIYQVAHNFIIELIVNWGIIGAGITYFLFRRIRKSIIGQGVRVLQAKQYRALIPLSILLILSLTRHSPLNISFTTQFAISCMVIFVESTMYSINNCNS